MKILAIGCSLTAGEELPDVDDIKFEVGQEHQKFFLTSELAYPSLIAKTYNAELTNLSMNGGSNGRIFRKAMSESSRHNYDLIIIGWALYQRLDFQYNGTDYPLSVSDPDMENRFPWLKEFYANHYSGTSMIELWLAFIVSLQNHFKFKNQKYLFLGVDVLNQDEKLLFPELVNEVDQTYYLGWPDEHLGGANTPKDNIGPKGHPLEKGHQVIAEKIIDKIKELKWFENQ